MKRLLCELFFSCVMGTSDPMSVDELTYRSVLYDYYQEDYGAALVDVLVAEQQNRLGDDPLRFALAKGSVAFEDGLYNYASNAFAALPEAELKDVDRMRIGFHLARVRHRQQDWDQLAIELDKVTRAQQALGMDTHPEVSYMNADLALQSGDFARAGEAIDLMDDDEPFRGYALFNLGVELRDSQQLADSVEIFRLLEAMPGKDPQVRDLKQRGRLALAHLSKAESQSEDAKTILEDLPTGSRYRDAALAAYGTLAMEQKDYNLAARIWLTLKQDEKWQTSNAIAHLGFPMALEGMSEPRWVLTHYQSAEREYGQRLAVLQGVQERAGDSAWVRRLAQAVTTSGVEEKGLAGLVEEWDHDIGREEWLEWLAAEDVNNLLREWRSLADMSAWLGTVSETLEAFAEVSVKQVERTRDLRTALADEKILARRTELQSEIFGIDERLAWLDANQPMQDSNWMLAMANAEQRAKIESLLAMLVQSQSMTDAEGVHVRERVERLLGLVFYELANEYPDQRWRLARQKQAVVVAVADVDASIDRVQTAEQAYAGSVGLRSEHYVPRVESLSTRITQAMQTRELALAEHLQSRMKQESERIEQYLFLTRVAIAQASDQLALSEDHQMDLEAE